MYNDRRGAENIFHRGLVMACITHECRCGEAWFDNQVGSRCPVCNEWDSGHFDEEGWDNSEDRSMDDDDEELDEIDTWTEFG